MKASILLPSFNRPNLLKLGLLSIQKHRPKYDFEIVVLNDYLPDTTEEVCKQFPDLNIKYFFTGQRNLKGEIIKRVPGFALNIGIKKAEGDVIILSCPEMYHLNNALDILLDNLLVNPLTMVIPRFIYFDQSNETTSQLISNNQSPVDLTKLVGGSFGSCHTEMPYLMALYKNHLVEIGGYLETMTGHAGEDCQLINRLKLKGLTYTKTDAEAIHLWHSGTGDGNYHFENPAWVYNWNILQQTKDILIANEGIEWGVLDG